MKKVLLLLTIGITFASCSKETNCTCEYEVEIEGIRATDLQGSYGSYAGPCSEAKVMDSWLSRWLNGTTLKEEVNNQIILYGVNGVEEGRITLTETCN